MPPVVLQYSTPLRTGPSLKLVATYQRTFNLCILAQVVVFIALLGDVAVPQATAISDAIALAYRATVVTGAVFTFMLAIKLYDTGNGICLGILTLIPILGMFILLIVNGKATKLLQKHGIRVGLFGANPFTETIDDGPDPPKGSG